MNANEEGEKKGTVVEPPRGCLLLAGRHQRDVALAMLAEHSPPELDRREAASDVAATRVNRLASQVGRLPQAVVSF